MKVRLLLPLIVSLLLSACAGGPALVASDTQPTSAPAATNAPAPTMPAAPTTAVAPTTTVAEAQLSITDTAGTTLTFAKPPERIIAMGVRDLEILAALGIPPIAVGPYSFLTKLAQNPLYFAQPNNIATLRAAEGELGVDLEEIAKLKPDLMFGWPEVRTALQDVVPVYDAYNKQDTYEDSLTELRKFASFFGREAQAEQAIRKFEDRLAAYKQRSPKNVSVMYVGGTTKEVFIRHEHSGTCNLFKEVAICDWKDPKNDGAWSYTTSLEGLLQLDPDVLLLESWDEQLSTAELIGEYEKNPLLAELTAVKNQRLVAVEGDAKDLDGMGVVGATRMLDTYMPILYPEVFPQPLTDAQVQEILVGAAPAAGAYTITDETGATLTFAQPPERVVCMFHECIELMSALGVEPAAIIAPSWLPKFAEDPAYFAQPNDIVQLGESGGGWDYEQIAALKPDIVFGGDEERTALKEIAQVYSFGNSYSMVYEDTEKHLLQLGKLLGREAAAQQAIDDFRDRLAAYAKRAPRSTSVMLVASDLEMVWLYSGKSVACSILNQLAKCDWPNPKPEPGSWGYATSIEELLQINPDTIIFENWSTEENDAALAKLKSNPLWAELAAVKAGRVFPMQNRDAYGLGPVGGARLLDLYVPKLYPDIFPAPLTDAQVKEILGK
jgi:iron complex transport system substrate-binding protein